MDVATYKGPIAGLYVAYRGPIAHNYIDQCRNIAMKYQFFVANFLILINGNSQKIPDG